MPRREHRSADFLAHCKNSDSVVGGFLEVGTANKFVRNRQAGTNDESTLVMGLGANALAVCCAMGMFLLSVPAFSVREERF